MTQEDIIRMAREAGIIHPEMVDKTLERFAALVREDERERVTNMLLYLHNKAAPYHNYYKHAAIELNREAGEGEKS